MVTESGELIAVGRAGVRLDTPVRRGDRLVRSRHGEGVAYSGIVMSETVESAASLASRGIPVEHGGVGGYVEVLEFDGGGARQRSIGRRLTDAAGRTPAGQTLFRSPHEALRFAEPPRDAVLSYSEQAVNWCVMRQTIAATAHAEEVRWRRANGSKLRENEAAALPLLDQYWQAVPGFANNAVRAARVQLSANDQNDGEWSAAFICFVMQASGVTAADGFVFSGRHLSYIVGALRNREESRHDR